MPPGPPRIPVGTLLVRGEDMAEIHVTLYLGASTSVGKDVTDVITIEEIGELKEAHFILEMRRKAHECIDIIPRVWACNGPLSLMNEAGDLVEVSSAPVEVSAEEKIVAGGLEFTIRLD